MTALPFIENSEVFFGLVGPVGVDLKLVSKCLEVELTRLNYRTVVVRLSDLLFSTIFRPQQKFDSEFDRLDQLMTAGDQLRANSKQTDALAMLAVYALHEARRAITGDSRITGDALKQPERIAYIFHSLKHPGEASLLRNLYGRLFNLVSVYAPRHERLDALAQRLAQSETNSDPKRFRAHAEQLIERDMQAGNEFGQNVQDTFPLADFFLRLSSEDSMREHIRRYIEILFGYQFHTPTRDEHGMFNAKAAALRSADLSRQVGAILASHQGDILGSGCNEVPMAGGGIVWCDDEVNDHRDLRLGYDTNAKKKGEILGEILNELKRAGWLTRAKSRMDTKSLVTEALKRDPAGPLRETRAANIIEFGRMVHAEMNALMDTARRGVSTDGSWLYCTTFPCHMCARHILSAGVERVIYIEPYPKSLAKELYKDEISVDGDPSSKNAVRFEAFVGVAPRRYIHAFDMEMMPKRKNSDTGERCDWMPSAAQFKSRIVNKLYLDGELRIVGYVGKSMRSLIRFNSTRGGRN